MSTCTWEPDPGCLGAAWTDLDPAIQARALSLATSALQMLTYNRVGLCPIVLRPVRETARCGCGWNPHTRNGRWYNNCSHSNVINPDEFDIPGPVGYIVRLTIDGVDQDLTNGDWRLDNGTLLVWQGEGPSPLPLTQDLSKPDTEVGTWSITYSRSYPVLSDARVAVAYLAAEFAEACKPKGKCSLPKGVRTVNRNGVSFTIEAGLFPNGLTGLPMADAFILKWAPAGAPQHSAVVFDPRSVRSRISTPLRVGPPPVPPMHGNHLVENPPGSGLYDIVED